MCHAVPKVSSEQSDSRKDEKGVSHKTHLARVTVEQAEIGIYSLPMILQ